MALRRDAPLDWMLSGPIRPGTLKAIRESHAASRLPILRARVSAHLSQSDMVSNLETEKSETRKRMALQMRCLMEARSKG